MSIKLGLIMLGVFLLAGLSPPLMAQENLAQILVEKGMAKIIKLDIRKITRIDIENTTEKYDKEGTKKSGKTEHKTTDARLEVRGISMEELYQAFQTRYDFYIDMNESTAVINDVTYAVVKFGPKPNLTIKKTADQLINRSEGSIYINLDNFDIVKIHGFIKDPFDFIFYWKFIPLAHINVYQFEFTVEYTTFNNMTVEQSVGGIADYDTTIQGRGMEKFTNKISNYRMKN